MIGSEDGQIIADEEYKAESRITLEEAGCSAPYSITCGIYGLMIHTAFAASKDEAIEKYDKMKAELQTFLDSNNDNSDAWCETFTNKW